MFMDAFSALALSSSQFMHPVVSFVRTLIDETANEWRLTAKAEGFTQQKGPKLGLLFHLRPLRVTRPIARSIVGKDRIPVRQRRRTFRTKRESLFLRKHCSRYPN